MKKLFAVLTAIFLLVVMASCSSGGGGSANQSSTGKSVDLSIVKGYITGTAAAGSKMSFMMSGTDNTGQVWEGNITFVSDGETTFESEDVTKSITTFSRTKPMVRTVTSADYYLKSSGTFYKEVDSLGNIYVPGKQNPAFPDSANIGDSGILGDDVCSDGTSATKTWQLEADSNGNSKFIAFRINRDASNVETYMTKATLYLDSSGNPYKYSITITYSDGTTFSLSGLRDEGGDPSSKFNLTSYQDTAWSDKIIVSTNTGDHVDDTTLTSDNDLYIDWAYINNGSADITQDHNVKLYVDNVLRDTWAGCNPLEVSHYCHADDYLLGKLSVGIHKIKMLVDADNRIIESNESDNEYTKTITVKAPGNTTTYYSMSGTIHVGSDSGATLSGATVSIAGKTNTTSSTGTFTFADIPAGTYAFSVSKSGYDTYTDSAYYVGSNQTGLNFHLTQTVTPPSGIFPIGTWDGGQWGSFTVSKLIKTSGSVNYYSGSVSYSRFGTKTCSGSEMDTNCVIQFGSGTFFIQAQNYTSDPTIYTFTATVNDPSTIGSFIAGNLIINTSTDVLYDDYWAFTRTK